MTRKTKIILVFVSIFFIVYIINRYFFTMYHSTTINGVVINKVSNPSSITLKTFNETASDTTVSYTHLDVYKRQAPFSDAFSLRSERFSRRT